MQAEAVPSQPLTPGTLVLSSDVQPACGRPSCPRGAPSGFHPSVGTSTSCQPVPLSSRVHQPLSTQEGPCHPRLAVSDACTVSTPASPRNLAAKASLSLSHVWRYRTQPLGQRAPAVGLGSTVTPRAFAACLQVGSSLPRLSGALLLVPRALLHEFAFSEDSLLPPPCLGDRVSPGDICEDTHDGACL